MWKCPKCGRSFMNENQQHFCGKAPETIDEYTGIVLCECDDCVRNAVTIAESMI